MWSKPLIKLSLLVCLISIPILPRFASAAKQTGRHRHYGMYLSFLAGDPFPLPFGYNLAYQPFSFLRFHGGLGGTLVDSFGWSTGARIILPVGQLSPIAGVGYSEADTFNSKVASNLAFTNTKTVRHYIYGLAGVDFFTEKGFNLTFGFTWEIRRFVPDSPEHDPHAFMNVGYYFP